MNNCTEVTSSQLVSLNTFSPFGALIVWFTCGQWSPYCIRLSGVSHSMCTKRKAAELLLTRSRHAQPPGLGLVTYPQSCHCSAWHSRKITGQPVATEPMGWGGWEQERWIRTGRSKDLLIVESLLHSPHPHTTQTPASIPPQPFPSWAFSKGERNAVSVVTQSNSTAFRVQGLERTCWLSGPHTQAARKKTPE